MDWGWKRKKRTGIDLFDNSAESSEDEDISEEDMARLMDLIYQNNDENEEVSKRNIGSVLKNDNDKRSIASLARSDEVFILIDHQCISIKLYIIIQFCYYICLNVNAFFNKGTTRETSVFECRPR